MFSWRLVRKVRIKGFIYYLISKKSNRYSALCFDYDFDADDELEDVFTSRQVSYNQQLQRPYLLRNQTDDSCCYSENQVSEVCEVTGKSITRAGSEISFEWVWDGILFFL